eukprot:SAG31_NODE_2433_length_5706_cov_2.207776_2_plen_280_part_00
MVVPYSRGVLPYSNQCVEHAPRPAADVRGSVTLAVMPMVPLRPDDVLGTVWSRPAAAEDGFTLVERTFTSARGTQLYGKHLLVSKDRESLGSILCTFGAGDHCNSPYHGGQMVTLAKMGFDVHAFDYESLGRSSPTRESSLNCGLSLCVHDAAIAPLPRGRVFRVLGVSRVVSQGFQGFQSGFSGLWGFLETARCPRLRFRRHILHLPAALSPPSTDVPQTPATSRGSTFLTSRTSLTTALRSRYRKLRRSGEVLTRTFSCLANLLAGQWRCLQASCCP